MKQAAKPKPAKVTHRAPPPALTLAERREALTKAAEVRRRRAELKNLLKTGKIPLRELLAASTDEVAAKLKVAAALESLPGVGKSRARRIMQRLQISETRRLRGLGDRQVESLLREFE